MTGTGRCTRPPRSRPGRPSSYPGVLIMSKVKYPDDIIRARRQSIEVAENLEIWVDGDEFVLELFREEHSVHRDLAGALDEAASVILENQPMDSMRFVQTNGVWGADMDSLREDLYRRRIK